MMFTRASIAAAGVALATLVGCSDHDRHARDADRYEYHHGSEHRHGYAQYDPRRDPAMYDLVVHPNGAREYEFNPSHQASGRQDFRPEPGAQVDTHRYSPSYVRER